MRATSLWMLTLAAGLLLPALVSAQYPGGRSSDPNERWNQFSGGSEVWVRSKIADPRQQRIFDFIAQQVGVTNGQITRQQYLGFAQQRMAARASRTEASPSVPSLPVQPGFPAAAPSGDPRTDPAAIAARADDRFRRYDQNGDGLLNYDEMPESLRAERDKWDANHDGLIDLNEYRAYYLARTQQKMAERAATTSTAPSILPFLAPPPEEEVQKPVVYRAGKLPKELPAWFEQMDTDGDGQIGLYEWRAAGRSVDEFQRYDRNDDGFVTAEEVLHLVAMEK